MIKAVLDCYALEIKKAIKTDILWSEFFNILLQIREECIIIFSSF